MPTQIALIAALFLCSSPLAVVIHGQPELRPSLKASRALWVVRDAFVSPSAIKRTVADAHRAGTTDLLVQVRGRGDAYYLSDLVPIASPLQEAWKKRGFFDPLQMIIDEARPLGIRVHAWMNVYLVAGEWPADPRHVLRTNPEWAAVDARGRSLSQIGRAGLSQEFTEGVYLDPGSGSVVNHFVNVVRELVERYAVDGIHLDYVRYPYLDTGYSDVMRRAFRNREGIDPLELTWNREGLERERGPKNLLGLQQAWNQFRADKVTALVYQVRQTLRMNRPGVILSAAVKPDPEEALNRYGQDWIAWVNQGLVDVVAPMMYSKSTHVVRSQIKRTLEDIPADRIWVGIAVYNQTLDSAVDKIRAVRDAGIEAISIFSYNSVPDGASGLKRLMRAR